MILWKILFHFRAPSCAFRAAVGEKPGSVNSVTSHATANSDVHFVPVDSALAEALPKSAWRTLR